MVCTYINNSTTYTPIYSYKKNKSLRANHYLLSSHPVTLIGRLRRPCAAFGLAAGLAPGAHSHTAAGRGWGLFKPIPVAVSPSHSPGPNHCTSVPVTLQGAASETVHTSHVHKRASVRPRG